MNEHQDFSRDEAAETIGIGTAGTRTRALRRYWPAFAAALLVGGGLGYGGSYLVTPMFTSSTLFIPPQQQQSGAGAALASLGALSSIVGGGAIKSPVDQYISMLQGVTVSDRVIQRFDLAKVYETKLHVETRGRLARHVQIAAGKKDNLIRVDVEDADPARAAAMANDYVEELRILTSSLAVTEAQQRRVFFEHMLQDTKQKLTNAQVALQSSGIGLGAIQAEPHAAADAYAKLRAQLTAAQVKLQVMRGSMADGSPQVLELENTVSALGQQIAAREASQSEEQNSPDYIGKYRDFKYQQTLFELFAKQYELARVDESREGALVQVVDVAQPAELKSSPRRSVFALGGGVLAALALLALLWRRTDPVVVAAGGNLPR